MSDKKSEHGDIGKLAPGATYHKELDAYATNGMTEPNKSSKKLTPNLRALRLAMTVADQLLSMDIAANSVTSQALDITDAYCDGAVHIDIISNLIMVSQLRDTSSEPLTLIRPSTERAVNNMTVQRIQQFVREVCDGAYTLDQAEARLDDIIRHQKHYPGWLISVASAAIAAIALLFFTTDWRAIVTTFAVALSVDRLLALMAKRALPPFFRQTGASIFIVLAAALVAQLGKHGVVFFEGINPTLIAVGGIFMLVAGLAIVGAVRDAIEEYYITANARMLKVAMQTSGIVVGFLIGLYAARQLGIGIAVSAEPLSLTTLPFQIVAGGLFAGAFALSSQTRVRAVIWATLVAGGTVGVMTLASRAGLAAVPATGVAAVYVGVISALFSRLWTTPSSAILSAGILPLVPGLALYTGLMQLINYPPGDPFFYRGIGTLFTALATALTIAAGASFGAIIAQPVSRTFTQRRNLIPFGQYMVRQLKFARRLSTPAKRK